MARPPPRGPGVPVVDPELPLPPSDLMVINSERYKINLCTNLTEEGRCRYGAKCHFAHTQEEVRPAGYGPTPEEAARAGKPLSPVLVAWWNQARRELALQRAAAAKPKVQPQPKPPQQAPPPAVPAVQEDEETRRLRMRFAAEFEEQQQWDQQHPQWQEVGQRGTSANGAAPAAVQGHRPSANGAPEVTSPVAVSQPGAPPPVYQAAPPPGYQAAPLPVYRAAPPPAAAPVPGSSVVTPPPGHPAAQPHPQQQFQPHVPQQLPHPHQPQHPQQRFQPVAPQVLQQLPHPHQPQHPQQVPVVHPSMPRPAMPVIHQNMASQQQGAAPVAAPSVSAAAKQPEADGFSISDSTQAMAGMLRGLASDLAALHAQLHHDDQAMRPNKQKLEEMLDRVEDAKKLILERADNIAAYMCQLQDAGLSVQQRAELQRAHDRAKAEYGWMSNFSRPVLKAWKVISDLTGVAAVKPAQSTPAAPAPRTAPAPVSLPIPAPAPVPVAQPVVPQPAPVPRPAPAASQGVQAQQAAVPARVQATPAVPLQVQPAAAAGPSQAAVAPVQPNKPQAAAAPVPAAAKHQAVAIPVQPASVMPTVLKQHAYVITTVPEAAARPAPAAVAVVDASAAPAPGKAPPVQQQPAQKQEPAQKQQQQPAKAQEPAQKQQQPVQKQEKQQQQPAKAQEPAQKQQQPVQKQEKQQQQQQPAKAQEPAQKQQQPAQKQQQPVQKQEPAQKQPQPVQKPEPAQKQQQQPAQKQEPAQKQQQPVQKQEPAQKKQETIQKQQQAAPKQEPTQQPRQQAVQQQQPAEVGKQQAASAATLPASHAITPAAQPAAPASKPVARAVPTIKIDKAMQIKVDEWKNTMRLLHNGWANLYKPFFQPQAQSTELIEQLGNAVKSLETRPGYMMLQAAVRYYVTRCTAPVYMYNTPDQKMRDYLKQDVGDDFLVEDVANWRHLPGHSTPNSTLAMTEQVQTGCTKYVCALIKLVAANDADPLMRRLDTYMVQNFEAVKMPDYLWKTSADHTNLEPDDKKKQGYSKRWWYMLRMETESGSADGTLMGYVVKQRKTNILRFALELESPTQVFQEDVKALNPLTGSTNPMTGLLRWAKENGSDLEALQVLLRAMCDRKLLCGSRSDEVLLITNMMSDTKASFPHQLIIQAMESFKLSVQNRNPKYPLPWSYEVTPGKGMDCTFLHLALATATPENCWPLVQFSINKCLKELKAEPEADRGQFMGMFVRQKYATASTTMAPLQLALSKDPPLPHIKEIVQLLLTHGADPLADQNMQLVASTPLHNVVALVDSNVLSIEDGAELLGMMVAKCSAEDVSRVVAHGQGCPSVNVLAFAAISSRAPVRLVNALLQNCALDVVRLQTRVLPGPKGTKNKEHCTALSMALLAAGRDKDVNQAVARALVSSRPWNPLNLLAALETRQPSEHLDAVAAFAAANKDVMLEPLHHMNDDDLVPLKKASLEPGRVQLLQLLLDHVPNLKHDTISLWQVQNAEMLKRIVERGARIRLVSQSSTDGIAPGEVPDPYVRKRRDLQAQIQTVLGEWGPYAWDSNYLERGLLWEKCNQEQLDHCLDKTGRLLALLSASDEEGEYFETYMEGIKLSVARLFGMGYGALKRVAQLLDILLQHKCVDPNERDPKRCGMTLLHLACLDSAVESVEVLIKHGADVDAVVLPRDLNAEVALPGMAKLHDSLVGFTALHFVVQQFTDAHTPNDKTPVSQLLDMPGPKFAAPDYVAASGYRVLSALLEQDPSRLAGLTTQPAETGKNAKGKTPRQLIGTAAQRQPVREMYDEAYRAAHEVYKSKHAITTPVTGGDDAAKAKEKADKAAKERAAKEAARAPAPVKVDDETLLMQAVMAAPRSEDAAPLSFMVKVWAGVKPQTQENVLGQLVKVMVDDRQSTGTGAAGQEGTAAGGEAEDTQAATQAALQKQVHGMYPEHEGWKPEDDRMAEGQEEYDSSSDEEVEAALSTPVRGSLRAMAQTPSGTPVAQEAGEQPQQQALAVLDPARFLQDLEWMFTITKEARQSWASLPKFAKEVVLRRLRDMGQGRWPRAGGVKRFKTEKDDKLKGLDLWRLKINKGGRILFEVAVEYSEDLRCWSECIRLWCITLSHKKYEEAIRAVQDSYKRSQAVRERRKLQIMEGDDSSYEAAHCTDTSPQGVRHPKRFREISADPTLPAIALGAATQQPVKSAPEAAAAEARPVQQRRLMEQREHLPPATYDPEQFTLLKMYNVDVVLLQSVLQGLTDAQVELPFKLSPAEWDIITRSPSPPASILLLGRSGTGKTTCAVYRMWSKWLSGYKEWIPGARAVAAAAAADAALAAGDVLGVDALAERAARLIGGATVFVTASATLKETVKRAFRKMQMAAMQPDEYRAMEAAGRVQYHTFADVPPEAFPLFLHSRRYLEMLDATTKNPFFRRRADGSIIKVRTAAEEDRDSAEVEIDLAFDQEQDEEFADEEGAGANLEGEEEEDEEQEAEAAGDAEAAGQGAEEKQDDTAAGLAGRLSVAKEVTWVYFLNEMWPKITTPEQRKKLKPALVWAEICSYVKGSVEAISSRDGYLDKDAYVDLGARRAANFSKEMRETEVYPIFKKYQKLKAQEARYDIMDFVSHVYKQLERDGYQGVRIDALYRDEVQDFTQAELALDLRVVSDPNSLFYCGDTAQTIARGVGFRFEDIKVLLYHEGARRQQQALEREKREIAKVSMPGVEQLTTNYRTHQGILNTAAVVVDLLRTYYPNSIDKLERERALFEGPGPILLSGTQETDLTYLLSGSDRTKSQVEFGANQVILVRSMAAADQLPTEIRNSNALVMTVQQAKGLEFDDVFLVDFFANSPAPASEWRVLNYFVDQLKEQLYQLGTKERNGKHQELLKRYEEHSKSLPCLSKEDEGHLRPVQFEPTDHVLLQEELKHLYTAITRAKSNVVVFDRSPERRAPFYHLLRCLGMARIVNKSLLEDGSDAVVYGLSQRASNSQEEWFKRAKSLMERGSPGLAASAFRQAGDFVRAEVALARHLRLEAAGATDQDQSMQQKTLSREEKRRMLVDVAFRCLGAARHKHEAPVKVSEKEHFRWIRLAAQCLTEVGQLALAAQLQALTHGYKPARELLTRLGQHSALAAVCMRAYNYYTAQARAAQVRAEKSRSALVISGAKLAEALTEGAVGRNQQATVALAEEDAREAEQTAVKARRHAQLYLARAAYAYYVAGEYSPCMQLLREHEEELRTSLQNIWPTMGHDLVKVAAVQQAIGQKDVAVQALHLAADGREKEERLMQWEMWDELVALRRGRGDFLGAAQVLMSLRQHREAAKQLLHLMAARSHLLMLEEAGMDPEDDKSFAQFDAVVQKAALQPVPAAAFSTLVTCVLALRSAADARSLLSQLQYAKAAAAEAQAEAQLQLADAHARVIDEVLADGSLELTPEAKLPELVKSVSEGNWLSSLELSYSKELPWLNPAQSQQSAGAAAAHILNQVLSSPSVNAAASIPVAAAPSGDAAQSADGQEVLRTCSQWLDNAHTVLEGLHQLLQLRTPTEAQQALLQQLETHYGLGGRTPMGPVTAVNFLTLDPSPVYLGDASYVWAGLTQSASKARDQGAQELGLPDHATRQPIALTLAWDIWRKLHVVVLASTLQAVHRYMSALQAPQQLSSVTAVKAHVMPLLVSLWLLQRLDSLHKLRVRMLNDAGAGVQQSSKQRGRTTAVVFPDKAVPVSALAVQRADEYRRVVDYQQRVVTALVGTSALLPAHLPNMCSELISNFGRDLLEQAAGISLQEFQLDTLRVFDAGYPNYAKWQGANFGCWWALSMLLQKHSFAMTRICQKHTPPQGIDRALYIRNANGLALPEEILARGVRNMSYGEPDNAVPDMLAYLQHSLKLYQSLPSASQLLALEPSLLLLEVVTCTLTMGVADGPYHGNKELQGPRAYLPAACMDLLYDMPYMGVRSLYEINETLDYWSRRVKPDRTHNYITHLVDLMHAFAGLLTSSGPALATMAQHQMIALCATHACQKAPAPTLPSLDSSAQQMRAALLALRLAHIVACMLLTLEVSRATWSATGDKSHGVAASFCPNLRKALSALLPVLQAAAGSKLEGADSFKQHAEHVSRVQNASKLSDLVTAVVTLTQSGLKEITPTAMRDCTGYQSAAWKQLLKGPVTPTPPKSQSRADSTGAAQTGPSKRGPAGGAPSRDLLSLRELDLTGSQQSEKEQQHKAARVIQQRWRSWVAARAAAKQRAEHQILQKVTIAKINFLYKTRPELRTGLTALKLKVQGEIEARKIRQKEQQRRLAMQEAARQSGLLGSIQQHRSALEETDNYLGMSGLTLLRCPVCPKSSPALATQHRQQVGAPQAQIATPLAHVVSKVLDLQQQHVLVVQKHQLAQQLQAAVGQQKESSDFRLQALLPELQAVEEQIQHADRKEVNMSSAEYMELCQRRAKLGEAVSTEVQQQQQAVAQYMQLTGNIQELSAYAAGLNNMHQQLIAAISNMASTAAATASAAQPRADGSNVWQQGTSQQLFAAAMTRRPEAPGMMPSNRLWQSALRPTAPSFVQHSHEGGHKKAAEDYKQFRTVYLEIMCSCLWWAEVTRLAAEKAINALLPKQSGQEAQQPAAQDAAQSDGTEVVDKQALVASLASLKTELEFCVNKVKQQVHAVLQQRNWFSATRSMQQQAVEMLRHVVSTCKGLIEAGEVDTLMTIIRTGREHQGGSSHVQVLYEPETKQQRKEEGMVVRAGKVPPALCKLAGNLLGEAELNKLLGIEPEQAPATPQAVRAEGDSTAIPGAQADGERSLLEDEAYANQLGKMLLGEAEEGSEPAEEEEEEEEENVEDYGWEEVVGKRGKANKAGRRAGGVGGGGARNARTPQAARLGRR